MGAQLIKEVSTKTNDVAGDGTTSATVLAQAMIGEGLKNLAAGANPMVMKKGIQKATKAAVEAVKTASQPVSGSKDIARVGTISSGDEDNGSLIAEAMEKVSQNGVITIEESKTAETYSDVVEGMQFDRGYLSPYMATDMDKMEAVIDDALILITDKKITNIQEILPLLEQIVKAGRKLLIIAEDVEGEALATIILNKLRGTFTCVCVKAPGFGDRRKEMLQDIAILTGIAWDHMNVFPTFENYVEQFALFTQQITPNGKLIYYENDENLRQIASRVPASVQAIPYTSFPHYTEEGTTYLAGSLPTPIQVFGEHNLQNISAAYLACKELGIDETAFLKAIATYKGAAKRLQKIAEQNDTVVFLDFAHSPSKLQATIKAVREQYPRRKLIACMELHTFSSLNAAFLPQYRHTMDLADEAIVFFNPEVVKHKRLPEISSEDVRKGFDDTQLKVFTDNRQLLEELTQKNYENSVLLIMTSGNFSGIDIKELATQLIHK